LSAALLTAGGPEAAADPAASRRILILGDSLTSGYGGVGEDRAYPALIQGRVDSLGWSFRVVNAGLSGDTSAGGVRRITWLLRRPIDILVLALGANDGLRGIDPDHTRANLQAIIDSVRNENPATVVTIAGMQMPPNMGADYGDRFRAIFPELATTNDASLIPFLLENVGGNPDLNLTDRKHPNSDGHKIIARNVWTILHPILKKMQ